MKKLIAVLLCSILLLTAGCMQPAGQTEETMVDTTAAQIETTETTELTEAIIEEPSLNALRQAMVETPKNFAVAYFGYPKTIESDAPADPFIVMQENAPELCEDFPFLLEIPEERVVGQTGDLFCIVPLDADATVTVNKGTWDDKNEQYLYEDILYRSESGEPILLFCNDAGWEPDTQVSITGPSGVTVWYPQIDDNQCAMPLLDENGEAQFYDFSSYRETLMADYRNMKNSEWAMPTAEMLSGSVWCWSGYLKDGREVSYRLAFHGNTLSVRWNDGVDAQDHEYTDALWELIYDENFAVLSIDFREFAGVLRYNLLYHEAYDRLYVCMDVVQEEMPIGWEPLYRFLSSPVVPEPVEMIGTWELAWTEVEGDRNEVEPGTEHISVFLNDQSVFRITLVNEEFPQENFSDKELAVCEGELYHGCGNDQWMAYVGYTGNRDIIYSVTMPEDDMLFMELYWEIDGAPMVAHKGYHRIE